MLCRMLEQGNSGRLTGVWSQDSVRKSDFNYTQRACQKIIHNMMHIEITSLVPATDLNPSSS